MGLIDRLRSMFGAGTSRGAQFEREGRRSRARPAGADQPRASWEEVHHSHDDAAFPPNDNPLRLPPGPLRRR